MPRGRNAIYVKLSLVALIWAGTFIAGRIVAAEMPPATAALWRYVVASVALAGAHAWLVGVLPRLRPRQWLGVTLLGATGVAAYNLCFMVGMQTVPASRASLIVALNPAVTVLGAAWFLHERLTASRVAGAVLALAGASVVIGHGNPLAILGGGVTAGDAIIFGCVLSWSTYTLIGKGVLTGLSPLSATTYASLTGTALLALAAMLLPAPLAAGLGLPPASITGWIALVFLGMLGTAVAFVWFYEGVREFGPARAAVFINLVPVAAVALGFALLGEQLEWSMLAGGALVIGGVRLINRVDPRTLSAPLPHQEKAKCC
jgi:drug/metabolite transporter (DMT)-like permease